MVKAASAKDRLLWIIVLVAILSCISGYPAEAGNNDSLLATEESKDPRVTHRKRSAPEDPSTIKLTSIRTPNDTAGENLSRRDEANQVYDFNTTTTESVAHISPVYRITYTDHTDSGSTLNSRGKLDGEETLQGIVESHPTISATDRTTQIFGEFNYTDYRLAPEVSHTTVKNQASLTAIKEHEAIRNSPARLTLMDLNGPAIADGLENEYRTNLEHVRVKRRSADSLAVHGEDFGVKEPLRRDVAVRSAGKNGVDDEVPVSKSYRQADIQSAEGHGGSTEFLGSSSKFENPLKSRRSLTGHSGRRERRSIAVSGGRTAKRGGSGRKGKHRKKSKKKQKKHRKRPDKRSNSASAGHKKGGTSALVADGLQVESHVEKRDSGEARSERDVRKREVDGEDTVRGKEALRVERDEVSSDEGGKVSNRTLNLCRLGGGEEAKYFDDVREFDDEAERETHASGSARSVEKIRKEKATRSVEQIKKLVDKLIGKVGELETNLQIGEGGKKRKVDAGLQGNFTAPEIRSPDEAAGSQNYLSKDRGNSAARVDKMTDAIRSKLNAKLMALSGAREKSSGEIYNTREEKRSTEIVGRSEGVEKSRDKRKSHRKWDRWTDWSSCSVTCGKGRQIRWRHCVYECMTAETEMEEKSCQLPSCGPGKFLGIF